MDARTADLLIAELAAAQHGIVSASELLDLGLTRNAICSRSKSGRLHRIYAGVYAVGHRALTQRARFLAAVKACGPSAVLSHFSAAILETFGEWRENRFPDVTVPTGSHRRHPGVIVHRTNSLPARDTMPIDGIPVTTPARTLVDLAAHVSTRELRQLVRRAQGNRRMTVAQLTEAVLRLRPRRGISKLAEILAEGPAPTRTVLEDVVLDLIISGGFAAPEVNMPMRLDERRIVPDFRWPQQQLVIEADGGPWHDNKVAREDDAVRQALLESHGERVLRVTWEQALSQPSQTIARLRAAGAPSACREADSSGYG